jgi:enamine deaminase RidA (YjgF/YER057c/UK114 family)
VPSIEEKLAGLGLELPSPARPVGTYVPAVRTGDLLFLSGHGPTRSDGEVIRGCLGDDMSVEEGYDAARAVALNLIATMKAELGDLDRVRRIVKVLGMVRCTPDFDQHPKVINGASDLFVELWGDAGRHARSAVGMAALPSGIAVEIELVAEVS